jgi:hypothetical protein
MGRRDRHDDHHKPTPVPAPTPPPVPAPVPVPTPPPTPTPVPVPADYAPSLPIQLVSGQVVANKSFTSGIGLAAGNNGVAVANVGISHCLFADGTNGLKVGSGPQSSNFTVTGLISRNTIQPMVLANLSDSSFADLDFEVPVNTIGAHGIYLERGLHRLSFRNVRVVGRNGYCLHLYHGAADDSETLIFENLTLDATNARGPIVIVGGYSNIIFRNTTMIAGSGVCVRLEIPTDITFDGFTASGGSALVGIYDGQTVFPQRIVFRNGTYRGPQLGSVPGVSFENVSLV